MCILAAKYFPDYGWVAVKNRDRNYVPEISFKKTQASGVEILYFWDDITQYCEGMNSAGVGILSASLMVLDDEKEIETRAKTPSKDGKKIKHALTQADAREAVRVLIDGGLSGNTLVFDQEHMYLIEAAWRHQPGKSKRFLHRAREIPPGETVTRTNHGIWLPWAGYQRGIDRNQTLSRISSESRRLIAQNVIDRASSPEEIIDGLTENFTNNGQLNAIRTTTGRKKMRTTSQILIVPKEHTMYVRPVQSHMEFDFWRMNRPNQQTWIEILSNRVLYMNLRDQDLGHEPPFNVRLNHT